MAIASLYGSINHSIFYIYRLLEELQKDYDYTISILDTNRKFKKGDIYLALNQGTLQHFTKKLEGRRGVLILCETPVGLTELDGIKLLDGVQIPGADYRFRLQKLTPRKLISVIESLEKRPIIKIKRQRIEVLPDLIKRERSGKFLDKMNTLLYFGLGNHEQNIVRKEILKYLYERGTIKQLTIFLNEIFETSSKSTEYINSLIEFLNSKPGIALRLATQEIGKIYKKNKTPNYKNIADQHQTDILELTYLNKLYRQRPIKHPINTTYTKYSQEKVDKIRKQYIEGRSLEWLEKYHKISRSTVRAILHQKGVFQDYPISPDIEKELKKYTKQLND